MLIKIESDVFDIVDRVKKIDKNYFIVFNTNNNKFELHNSNQLISYCLTFPYTDLDVSCLNFIYETLSSNIDNIMQEIDINNDKIEKNQTNSIKAQTDYMAKEVFKYANNSTKKYEISKAFSYKWS